MLEPISIIIALAATLSTQSVTSERVFMVGHRDGIVLYAAEEVSVSTDGFPGTTFGSVGRHWDDMPDGQPEFMRVTGRMDVDCASMRFRTSEVRMQTVMGQVTVEVGGSDGFNDLDGNEPMEKTARLVCFGEPAPGMVAFPNEAVLVEGYIDMVRDLLNQNTGS